MAIFFPLPGNDEITSEIASLTSSEVGELELRPFPDGETYVRILSPVKGKNAYLVCTLARPDEKVLPLAFAARAIRDLGARSVRLVAPYLAYMRQDRIFHPGEALTSRLFAEFVQPHFDALITVDPHLHRTASLDETYDIPSTAVSAAPLFAAWIGPNVARPVVIGPDAESTQWVKAIAEQASVPWTVLRKKREGDRRVRLEASDLDRFRGHSAILVDDIVSSGASMRAAIQLLREWNFAAPICLVVHALCNARTARQIRDQCAGFLTSNTVANADAEFDVAPLLAQAIVSAAALEPA